MPWLKPVYAVVVHEPEDNPAAGTLPLWGEPAPTMTAHVDVFALLDHAGDYVPGRHFGYGLLDVADFDLIGPDAVDGERRGAFDVDFDPPTYWRTARERPKGIRLAAIRAAVEVMVRQGYTTISAVNGGHTRTTTHGRSLSAATKVLNQHPGVTVTTMVFDPPRPPGVSYSEHLAAVLGNQKET